MNTETIGILLVEDNPGDAHLLQEILSEAPAIEFELVWVERLAEASKHLTEPGVDVVLLNLSLPDAHGFQTIRQTRAIAPNVPVIVLTDSDDEALAFGAVRAGAQDYLVKGQIGPNLLARSIRYAIERKQTETALQRANDELELKVTQRTQELRESNEQLRIEINERKRAQAELSAALAVAEYTRDKIDAIFNSMAGGLMVTDIHNCVIRMNWAAEELLGLRLAEALGEPIEALIPHEALRTQLKMTLDNKTGQQFDFELPAWGKQNNPAKIPSRIIRANTAVILDKNQQPGGIITTMYDVTYEREVERMKDEFISTAAHELRTPLTSIQGFSEVLLIRENLDSASQRKYLNYIHQKAVALTNIVKDILDISRIEAGQGFALHKISCQIGQIISPVIFSFQERFTSHQFELDLVDESREWLVDPAKITQVLENLLSNAVKYSPPGKLVRVSGRCQPQGAESTPDHYQISVIDQGIGLAPDQVDKIFDKFYRVDMSNTAVGGVGLGLAIAKHIVEAHQGQIWVESAPGQGTTVIFTIPCDRPDERPLVNQTEYQDRRRLEELEYRARD